MKVLDNFVVDEPCLSVEDTSRDPSQEEDVKYKHENRVSEPWLCTQFRAVSEAFSHLEGEVLGHPKLIRLVLVFVLIDELSLLNFSSLISCRR